MIREWRLPEALGGHPVDTKKSVSGHLGWYAVRVPGMACDIMVQGECLEAVLPPEPAPRSLVGCRSQGGPWSYFQRLAGGWSGSAADFPIMRTWLSLHKDFEKVTLLVDAGADDLENDPFRAESHGKKKLSLIRDDDDGLLYLHAGDTQLAVADATALRLATRILGDLHGRS